MMTSEAHQEVKNYGLDWNREFFVQTPEDFIAGSISTPTPLFRIPEEERMLYLPIGEVQKGAEDFMDCASRAPHNMIEIEGNYAIRNELFSPQNEQWLRDNGYIVLHEGKEYFEVSDAFTAILSGTTERGNSMKEPIHSIHKNGLIPKVELPARSDMTFDEYQDTKRVTDRLKKLGEEFERRFTVNYDRVYEQKFGTFLTKGAIAVGGFAWPVPENGEYPYVSMPPNHEFVALKKPKTYAYDNYIDEVDGDFIKKLRHDYDFYGFGYRVFISGEKKPEVKKHYSWFSHLLKMFT